MRAQPEKGNAAVPRCFSPSFHFRHLPYIFVPLTPRFLDLLLSLLGTFIWFGFCSSLTSSSGQGFEPNALKTLTIKQKWVDVFYIPLFLHVCLVLSKCLGKKRYD